jgi:hypothetical protein
MPASYSPEDRSHTRDDLADGGVRRPRLHNRGRGRRQRLIEVTPKGEVAWEFGAKDAPELNPTWVSSLQVLGNGHYVVGNFLRGQEGKGVHAFEVTKDKKVVWTFADHKLAQSVTTVRVLDDE